MGWVEGRWEEQGLKIKKGGNENTKKIERK